jgi:hypothetical protein
MTYQRPSSDIRAWGARLASDLDRDREFLTNIGTMELTSGTTTEVKNGRLKRGNAVFLQARSATAAASAAWISSVTDGTFTVTHGAGDASGRLFWYFIR